MKIGEKTPWTRMFWSDFAADTYHLDPMHLGIYTKLLLFMYQHARALPSERRMLAKICGASSDTELLVINEVITEYFHPFEDPEHGLVYRHHRVEREIEHAVKTTEATHNRAKAAANARWNKNNASSNAQAYAQAMLKKCHPDPEPEPERKEKTLAQTDGLRDSKFDEFWNEYPKKRGKARARDIWKRRKLDAKFDEIIEHVRAMKLSRDWLKDNGEFIPQGDTYLSKRRYEDGVESAAQGSARPSNYV